MTMAYCRFGSDCDVYLFANLRGRYEFWTATPSEPASQAFFADTSQEALQKLQELREKGLRIPQYAFDRLQDELSESP